MWTSHSLTSVAGRRHLVENVESVSYTAAQAVPLLINDEEGGAVFIDLELLIDLEDLLID